jgi:hypothetical protein
MCIIHPRFDNRRLLLLASPLLIKQDTIIPSLLQITVTPSVHASSLPQGSVNVI